MRIYVFLAALALFITISAASHAETSKESIIRRLTNLSIPFIENKGQMPDKVAFYARTLGGTIFITHKGEIVYNLPANKGGVILRESFLNSKHKPIRGERKTETRISHFIGKNMNKWLRNIPTYAYVDLGNIYDGIEVKLKAYGDKVEKIFYVKPDGKVERIRIKLYGADKLSVAKDGRLIIETKKGKVHFTKPVAYQEVNGRKKPVYAAYWVKGNEYGFRLGTYDTKKPVIIDPLLASTFLGGSTDYKDPNVIVTDRLGNVYVAGWTGSTDFPTTEGAYDRNYSDQGDAFISKLNNDLTQLLASTYLGGNGYDEVYTMAIDRYGNVYVAGNTSSTDFPTSSKAYDRTPNGYDAFISKFDSNLQNLIASTYLGGSRSESIYAMTLDGSGYVYVTGGTCSNDFPTTPGAYDRSPNGDKDVFVSKLDNNLHKLIVSTYLGGKDCDLVNSIGIDPFGNVYVAGWTYSDNFPTTPGSHDESYNGNEEGFISKFNKDLTKLLASTYLGGSSQDEIDAIAIDKYGNIYVAGCTESNDFPTTPGAYVNRQGQGDVFITKLNNNLSKLLASTCFGGSNWDWAYTMALDGSGNIYVAGCAESNDFPTTPGAYDRKYNGTWCEVFISKLNDNLTQLLASTYLGGNDRDDTYAIILDGSGSVYVAGWTYSSDFPTTPGAYNRKYNGTKNIFISKLSGNLSGSNQKGDIDQNNIVDIVDALITSRYYLNIQSGDNLNPQAANIDENNTIDINDAIKIAEESIGIHVF